jgi:GNAT superfamily N-acetyltransferase
MSFGLRAAVPQDIPALRVLIEQSARSLQTRDYSAAQIEGALATVYGVDTVLIEDGTYFVAENLKDPLEFAGCGGWSKRKTLFGADHWTGREDAMLDPATDAAKIRAFFVNPVWPRRGVGSALLDACESAATAAGFLRCEMAATLTGVKLFEARGYGEIERIGISVGDGLTLEVVRMQKLLTA